MTTHHFRIVYKRGERVTCSQLKMELRWKPPSVSFFRILVFHWVFQWRYFSSYYKLAAGIIKVIKDSSDIKTYRRVVLYLSNILATTQMIYTTESLECSLASLIACTLWSEIKNTIKRQKGFQLFDERNLLPYKWNRI